MITKTINLYEFKELSEEAKQAAINNLSAINVDHEWWDFIYADAKRIGLNIIEFDTDHFCNGKLLVSLYECCDLILTDHGPDCETFKLAKDYQKQWDELVKRFSDGITIDQVSECNEKEFDIYADDLEQEFTKSLLEDYRIILRNEYEYLTSKEAIIETIESNEYTFTENGKLENI